MQAIRLAALSTAAVTAFAGVACGADDDGGSPGQEAPPAEDTGGGEDDEGLY